VRFLVSLKKQEITGKIAVLTCNYRYDEGFWANTPQKNVEQFFVDFGLKGITNRIVHSVLSPDGPVVVSYTAYNPGQPEACQAPFKSLSMEAGGCFREDDTWACVEALFVAQTNMMTPILFKRLAKFECPPVDYKVTPLSDLISLYQDALKSNTEVVLLEENHPVLLQANSE